MILNNGNALDEIKMLATADETRDAVLEQFVTLAGQLLGIPGCFVSILDDNYQYIRAAVNFDLQKTPRNEALCRHVVDSGLPLIIADTRADEHFADHPLVTGTPFIRFYAGVPLVDSEGNIPGSFCVTDTVPHTFTQAQQATLTTMAGLVMKFLESWHFAGFTDPVTGLPNRQRLIHDLQEMSRTGDTHDRRLILIDGIDMPRAYELARSMGMTPVETLLRDITALVISQLQPQQNERVYTVATGRFAFLVQADDLRDAWTVAAGLQGMSADLGDNVSVDLMPCTGETLFIPGQHAPQEILRQAVSALHEAISSGKSAMRFESGADTRRTGDFTLMNDLAVALRHNRDLYLVYQPKVCLRTGKPVGLEALIRWHHPLRGELSPAMFIPLAEQTSLLPGLTQWVIDATIDWLTQLPVRHRLPVTVNVSEKDFARQDFADRLEDRMIKAGLPRSLLGIECLETERIIASPAALRGLEMLKLRGFSISLDDFGTGYSNISYLKQMALDVIKIDRILIRELSTSIASQIIVRNIIIMLKQLDYLVLAEGVEDEDTLEMLRQYGCDQVQGYYYSRPLTGPDIQQWLDIRI
ncbi:GGDEF and EAL domain-containing protein [Phytobacter sp. RSE-02]|uniref:sensor domain-containing diguanylate cyclase n=1 Tax=Phytobacter sp. RSE-02 TaxID=3229229 RepID=UPI00339D676E